MTQKQLRSLSRKGTGAVCRELPLFQKKRDTFCTSERCVESLNNYPFSLYICRMLSSSNGDDDIIPSCRQRIPALSLLFLSSSKKLRKAQEKQSYPRFQHVGHTAFNTSGTNVSCLLSRAKAGTHSAHLKESHTSAHTAKQGGFPPSATAQSCATSEITLSAISVIPDSATLLYTYISRFSVPPLSATALFKSCFRYCQSC